jgi:hypothetical protein
MKGGRGIISFKVVKGGRENILKKKSVKISVDKKVRVSQSFVIALAVVSILGFSGIISSSLFDKDISAYLESLLMIVMGIGLIMESQIKTLKNLKRQGITPTNFTHLTTAIIGIFALLAGVLSFPYINLQNPSFLATKGIVSVIAIIFIIIQTWIVE